MIIKEVKTKSKRKQELKRNIIAWLIALPSIAIFAFYVWIPLIQNVFYAFSSDNYFSSFAGIDNFTKIFNDPQFIAAIFNTFKYIFYSLVIGFLVPFF